MTCVRPPSSAGTQRSSYTLQVRLQMGGREGGAGAEGELASNRRALNLGRSRAQSRHQQRATAGTCTSARGPRTRGRPAPRSPNPPAGPCSSSGGGWRPAGRRGGRGSSHAEQASAWAHGRVHALSHRRCSPTMRLLLCGKTTYMGRCMLSTVQGVRQRSTEARSCSSHCGEGGRSERKAAGGQHGEANEARSRSSHRGAARWRRKRRKRAAWGSGGSSEEASAARAGSRCSTASSTGRPRRAALLAPGTALTPAPGCALY